MFIMSSRNQPKQIYEHAIADDIASANADAAFKQGKWQEFTGQDLASEPVIKSNYPDFYRPVEEHQVLDAEELAKASKSFNTLFDDLMLQGMDKVQQFEFIKGRPTANLSRRIDVDGQTFSLSLEEVSLGKPNNDTFGISFRDSERHTRLINLQRIDESYGREYWSYRLGADGIVRRWDGGDVTDKKIKERELGIEQPKMLGEGSTPQDLGKAALTGIKNITEGLPNARLEEDMGLNNQPVSPDEIDGLKAFISRATTVSR